MSAGTWPLKECSSVAWVLPWQWWARRGHYRIEFPSQVWKNICQNLFPEIYGSLNVFCPFNSWIKGKKTKLIATGIILIDVRRTWQCFKNTDHCHSLVRKSVARYCVVFHNSSPEHLCTGRWTLPPTMMSVYVSVIILSCCLMTRPQVHQPAHQPPSYPFGDLRRAKLKRISPNPEILLVNVWQMIRKRFSKTFNSQRKTLSIEVRNYIAGHCFSFQIGYRC